MKKKAFNVLLATCFLAISAFSAGCIGYKLGSMLPDDIKSVCVPTFINSTTEPLIEVKTTDETIAQFQFDGSLKVKDCSEADAILKVDITSYQTEAISFSKTDRRRAEEYRLTLHAHIVLTRRSNDEVIVENTDVTGESTFVLAGDMTSSKRRALPEASEDLAENIVAQVVEAWPLENQ